ncbi:hypothetical protein HDU93_006534 [Gonapodya sp. JEL0774]|nr:hypothetical protein HDU93_006534 [Gonapodya sp. JEL0774]
MGDAGEDSTTQQSRVLPQGSTRRRVSTEPTNVGSMAQKQSSVDKGKKHGSWSTEDLSHLVDETGETKIDLFEALASQPNLAEGGASTTESSVSKLREKDSSDSNGSGGADLVNHQDEAGGHRKNRFSKMVPKPLKTLAKALTSSMTIRSSAPLLGTTKPSENPSVSPAENVTPSATGSEPALSKVEHPVYATIVRPRKIGVSPDTEVAPRATSMETPRHEWTYSFSKAHSVINSRSATKYASATVGAKDPIVALLAKEAGKEKEGFNRQTMRSTYRSAVTAILAESLPHPDHAQVGKDDMEAGDGAVTGSLKDAKIKKYATVGVGAMKTKRLKDNKGGTVRLRDVFRDTHAPMQTPPSPDPTENLPVTLREYNERGQVSLIRNLKADGTYAVTAGTLRGLVQYGLVEGAGGDVSFLDTFLFAIRHFVTVEECLIAMKDYCFPPNAEQLPISALRKLLSIFKKWVGDSALDFSEPRALAMYHQILELLKQHEELAGTCDQVETMRLYEISQCLSEEPATPVTATRIHPYAVDPLGMSARILAEQLTLVDIHLFRAIKTCEFTVYLWGHPDERSTRSRHLGEFIDRFNQVGFWAATTVLTQHQAKDRARVVEKLVRVAKVREQIEDLARRSPNSDDPDTSAFHMKLEKKNRSLYLYRSHFDPQCVPTKAMAEFSELEEVFRYSSNFKAYRQLEHATAPPMLPFFGLFIKDLVFMNDGNQRSIPNLSGTGTSSSTTVTNSSVPASGSETGQVSSASIPSPSPDTPPKPESLYNFEKATLVHSKVAAVHALQKHTYPFTPDSSPVPAHGVPSAPSAPSAGPSVTQLLALPLASRAATRRGSSVPAAGTTVAGVSMSLPRPSVSGRRQSLAPSTFEPSPTTSVAGDAKGVAAAGGGAGSGVFDGASPSPPAGGGDTSPIAMAASRSPSVTPVDVGHATTPPAPVLTVYEYCKFLPTLEEKTLDMLSRQLEAPAPGVGRTTTTATAPLLATAGNCPVVVAVTPPVVSIEQSGSPIQLQGQPTVTPELVGEAGFGGSVDQMSSGNTLMPA